MDVNIKTTISNTLTTKTTTTTATTTTATTPTTSSTAGRTRNFIKKKRKFYLHTLCDMLKGNNETMGAGGKCDMRVAAVAAAATTATSQMSNSTATCAALVNSDARVCLICRQYSKECCQRCCQQHLQAAKAKATETTTSTDNNYRFSLINKPRQTVDNHNSKHNNVSSSSSSNNNSYCSQSKNLTTSTTTMTTIRNCSCLQHKSSCTATASSTATSSTTTTSSSTSSKLASATLASYSSPPSMTELSCLCNNCGCKSSNNNNNNKNNSNKAAIFCSCLSFNTTNRAATAATTLSSTATAAATSSLSSLSPPATTPTHQQHHSGTNDTNKVATATAAAATLATTTSATDRAASFAVSLFRNALRTFQFLILFIQMQFMRPIYNNKLNNINNNNVTNYNNNNSNNNKHDDNNTNTIKRQQQCPPLPRLKFRRNSYCYNATTINLNNNNNTSRKQQASTPPPPTTTRAPHLQHPKHHPQYLHSQHHQQQQQQQQLHRPQKQLCLIQAPSSRQHFRYCKMPNLSPLDMILIVLSFLSLILPSTHAVVQTSLISPLTLPTMPSTAPSTASQVRLSRTETVCKSLDIRNTPSAFRQLRNCTVIEGFLLMTLVNTHNQLEFDETYPLLTEVTEFIIVYRIHNLRSLAQIFPNLSVIRGRALHDGYALIIYSNPHLEDLGLSKLTVSRGGVRIQDNLLLCFVDTIDWARVVANGTDNVIMQNRASIECPRCPGDAKYDDETGIATPSADNELSCKEYHGRRHCWSSKACQKICPDRCRDNCVDENTCCNENCVGGCSAANTNECSSCRHFSIYSDMCTNKCPSNYYSYLDRRCLTSDDCVKIGTKYEVDKQETLVPYDGVCTTRCPDGFTKIDGKCTQCDGKCVQYCHGGLIDSVARAKQYHGCTHIGREGLIISIKRGGRHLMEELAFGLSSIEVIDTYLKVHRTIGMFSLGFFTNLKVINGTKLCEEKFALYVLENNDLETLWNPKQNVSINEGRVFFHFNPKLCYSVIDALRPMLKNNATFDKNEVATDSNGYKGSCNTEFLNATVVSTGSVVALVEIVNPLKFEDERTFIGYQYFVIEDEFRNQTKHEHRPCDDGWTASEPVKDNRYLFTGLAPYKTYAFYVKTMTISSEPRNAQSPIMYLKTKASEPTYVEKLTGYANSSTEIIINWERPAQAHGNLTRYKVIARLDRRNDNIQLGTRNYCKDPLKEAAKTDVSIIKTPSTEKPETAADCKCRKETNNYDDETEASIHGNIEFENSIQNFVYVKDSRAARNTSKGSKDKKAKDKSDDEDDVLPELLKKKRSKRSRETDFGDSFLFRHMRALPDESPDVDGDGSISSNSITTTPPAKAGTTHKLDNETRLNPNGDYYEFFNASVNASTKTFVFKMLKHFSTYMLGVEACREPEVGASERECSRVQTMFVRTQALDYVDKVENFQVNLETTNSSRYNIRLRWDPPTRPNGAVVSYTISYLILAQDAFEEKKCITALDYRNMTNGYVLSGLPTGNYSIKVRVNTLAGEGLFSNVVYIDIPPTKISSTVIALIVISIIVVLSIIAAIFLYMRKKLLQPPTDLKIFPTVNPYYISLQYIPDDWEVPRDRVIQLSPLGQGSFGMVYEGIMKNYNSSVDDLPCAIKTVNENATDRERMNFLNEASVMKQFDTYHVVRLLGVCSRGQPALVVMELMKNGDLKSYLRAHRPDDRDDVLGNLGIMMAARGIGGGSGLSQPPPLSRIYQMALEIADGMAYLSAKKFVHRDLAARNCMVAADLTVKIGDFGMTRDIYETDYYRKGTKGLLPVRWMPPESLRDGIYSSSSDVFSYGVVLWEMATLASQPYQGLSNDQVLRYVIDGGVMERPENCPDTLYRLMQKCWHHRPTARPTFMNIIQFLLEMADPNYRQVSFYHSAEGATVRQKELNENKKTSGDIFGDNDNDMDDVTTPLRVGEFNPYNLNMDNNSSVENHDSPTIIDYEHPNSPFSANVIIPGGKYDYDHESSHHAHTPSTSGDATGGVNLPAPPSNPRYPLTKYRLRHLSGQKAAEEEESPYVLPDCDESDAPQTSAGVGGAKTLLTSSTSGTKSADTTDERGYQIYDPSPNYREHVPYAPGEDDDEDDDEEEDFAMVSPTRRRLGTASSGGGGAQNLLPRLRGGTRATQPVIMPMSQSMPDEATGTSAPTMSSSLHPSTASAASSNASSTTTTTGGGGGKIPSLKRAVADMMPARLRNINRRIFSNHKRSGSTASHGSTSSNPNAASSSTNLTGDSGRGKSMSGQNLGTIESGSGSAGSYVAAPRFFTPAAGGGGASSSTSENPNYKLLGETPSTSGITAATIETSTPARTTTKAKAPAAVTGFITSTNPNYQLLNESVASAGSPKRAGAPATHTSENPNYELMQAPTQASDNYVMMSSPEQEVPVITAPTFSHLSENPNYQMMGAPLTSTAAAIMPPSSVTTQPFSTLSAALRREQSRDRFHNSGTPSSNSSPGDEDDEDDDEHVEHIEMERMPLSRPKSSGSGSRSRSQSQTRVGGGDESRTGTPTSSSLAPPSMTSSAQSKDAKPPTTFSLKEKWLRQQQQQQQQQAQQTPKPPPNGFIGRET